MKDFDEPGHLAPTGLFLAGTKYMVIQGEPGAVIRGKKVFFRGIQDLNLMNLIASNFFFFGCRVLVE